jgi:hypothetical protein
MYKYSLYFSLYLFIIHLKLRQGLHGLLHYPVDLDRPPNETDTDKNLHYSTDSNNHPTNSISFIPPIDCTSGPLHCELVILLFLQTHRETDRFFQLQEFSFCNPTPRTITVMWCLTHTSSRKWDTSYKCVVLRINLNILDGNPANRATGHPSPLPS